MEEKIYKEAINILKKCIAGEFEYNFHYTRYRRGVNILDKEDNDKYLVSIHSDLYDYYGASSKQPILGIYTEKSQQFEIDLDEARLIEVKYLFSLLEAANKEDLLVNLQKIANGK